LIGTIEEIKGLYGRILTDGEMLDMIYDMTFKGETEERFEELSDGEVLDLIYDIVKEAITWQH
jgi:hypothetical protein